MFAIVEMFPAKGRDLIFLLLYSIRCTSQDSSGLLGAVHPGSRPAEGELKAGEFCDTEMFRGECSQGEIIIMTLARYGRMKVGRCVEFHLGYINCFTDVTLHMDSRCSGRQSCEVRVPDAELEGTGPCLKELKNYLELSYVCIKVIKLVTHSCRKHEVNMTSESGYILPLSPSRELLECSTHFQPTTFWVLARPGQHVLLSLYDLSIHERKRRLGKTHWSEDSCEELLGWYKEMNSTDEEGRPICGGVRHSTVVRTRHHVVKMWFEPREPEVVMSHWGSEVNATSRVPLVVRYSVHGCPDVELSDSFNKLSPPPSSSSSLSSSSSSSRSVYFYEPTGNGEKLKVGCERGEWRWVLRCSSTSNTWIGQVGNCSKQPKGAANQKTWKSLGEEVAMSYGVAIVAGGFLGVFIALLIIIIISFNRKRRHLPARGADKNLPTRQMSDYSKVSKCSCLVAGRTLCQCVPQTSLDSKTHLANKTCLTSVSFTLVSESKEPLLLDRTRHNDLLPANHDQLHYGSRQQHLNGFLPDKCSCTSSVSLPSSPHYSRGSGSFNVCRKMSLIRHFDPVVECSENF